MASDGIWAPERRPLTVGLVATITLVAFESLAVATAMPEVAADLGGVSLYGWVFSAFMLGNLVGIILAGQQADRVGPRPPFTFGLILFGAGLLVAGFAPSMPVLVAARVVQGLGAGAVPSTAYVTIGRAFPESARPRMMAILSTAWIVPSVAGPALAGVVTEHAGWRWVFLGLLPLVVVSGIIAVRALRRLGPPGGDPGPNRVPLAVRVAIGAGLLLAGLTAADPVRAAILVVVGVAVALGPLRTLLPPGTFRAAGPLAAAVAARFGINFAFFGADAFIPLILNEIRGTSTTFAGLPLTAGGLGWSAGAWFQERHAARWGARRLATAGVSFLAVGVGGLLPVLYGVVPPATALPVWLVAGLGMGLVYPTITLVVLRFAPEGGEGRATASMQLADNLGFAIGTGLGGAAVAAGERLDWAATSGVAFAVAIPLLGGLVAIAIARRFPRRHIGTETDLAASEL